MGILKELANPNTHHKSPTIRIGRSLSREVQNFFDPTIREIK